MNLTPDQMIRLESLRLAVATTDGSFPGATLVRRAQIFCNFIKNGEVPR